jgi:hypothetical protein
MTLTQTFIASPLANYCLYYHWSIEVRRLLQNILSRESSPKQPQKLILLAWISFIQLSDLCLLIGFHGSEASYLEMTEENTMWMFVNRFLWRILQFNICIESSGRQEKVSFKIRDSTACALHQIHVGQIKKGYITKQVAECVNRKKTCKV